MRSIKSVILKFDNLTFATRLTNDSNIDKSLILKGLREHLNFKTDTELANFLDLKQNTLSTWKTINIIDYDLILSKCDNIDANWLHTDNGSIRVEG